MTILQQILANKEKEVEKQKQQKPVEFIKDLAEEVPPARDFFATLSKCRPAIIAECKHKSPSKGIIQASYDPVAIARSYERGGASAISVLTDMKYFGGDIHHLAQIRQAVALPLLRKDFIIDEYQIYEARAAGADSFLLICGVLDAVKLQFFLEIGRQLGMEALVETHSSVDIDLALETDAKIIGINNRNLDTFRVDLNQSANLAHRLGKTKNDLTLVCESGITGNADVKAMMAYGFSAFLVGETLVKSQDPEIAVKNLISGDSSDVREI